MDINYYAILPAPVRYDKNLSSFEKLLFAEVTSLTNKYGYCFCKNSYFAELYDMTKQHISSALSNLQKQEYIYIKLIYGEKKNEIKERRIYLTYQSKVILKEMGQPPIKENLNTPIKENLNTPIKENLKDISKENIITIINNSSNTLSGESVDLTSSDSTHMRRILSQKNKINPIPQKESSPNPLIEYWNSLPFCSTHKNPNTKLYQETSTILCEIKRGRYF